MHERVSAPAGPAGPGSSAPSPFLSASRALLVAAAAHGPVLDLACGRGRNALAAAAWGVPVAGLDRNPDFLAELRTAARSRDLPVSALRCDLEDGRGIPVRPGSCGAILVFRFLFRPLAPAIEEALAPGGLLLYETFTRDQRELGYGPTRDAFLLAPGELPTLFPRLRVLGLLGGSRGARTQARGGGAPHGTPTGGLADGPVAEARQRPARVLDEHGVVALAVAAQQRRQARVARVARRDQRVAHEPPVLGAAQRGPPRGAAPVLLVEAEHPAQGRRHPLRGAGPAARAARWRLRAPASARGCSRDTPPGRRRSRRPQSPCPARSGSGTPPRASIVVYEMQRVASSR